MLRLDFHHDQAEYVEFCQAGRDGICRIEDDSSSPFVYRFERPRRLLLPVPVSMTTEFQRESSFNIQGFSQLHDL